MNTVPKGEQAYPIEARDHLKALVVRSVTNPRDAEIYVDGIESAFHHAPTSFVTAARQLDGIVGHIEHARGPFGPKETEGRKELVDQVGATWLGFMGALMAEGRSEEVIEIARESSDNAQQDGRFVKVTGALWHNTVTDFWGKNPDAAKGMISAAHHLCHPLSFTFRDVVKTTAKSLGLNLADVVETVPVRTAAIHFHNAGKYEATA